jgi:fructose-1,6-bisphosphatase I
MNERLTLAAYLTFESDRRPEMAPVCETVRAIAEAGMKLAAILAQGKLAGALSAMVGESRDGDGQKALDVLAHDIVRDALVSSPVAVFASEEADEPEILDLHAKLGVAADPLDGSSNIDTLAPVGTIFSILHAAPVVAETFLQTGRQQLAAGFLIYGPQTALVLTLGEGSYIFTLDPHARVFVATGVRVSVPAVTREYAINGSNFRHWEPAVRHYVTDLMLGAGGPRGKDYNTRWLASMVADAYRILIRGGVYLYPADERRDYRQGRLRLVYEANPIAMLMEQAGAAASNGVTPILDLVPQEIHQRCPLVFGSVEEVRQVARAYEAPVAAESPLFRKRSLFRKTISAVESLA